MPREGTTTAAGRLGWIDTIRGLAACWVTLFHLNAVGHFAPSPYQAFASVGWLGVIMFFVVSGFSIQAAAQRVDGVRTFAWHRFWRIYPPYVASIALIVGLVVVSKLATGSNGFMGLPAGPEAWIAHAFVAIRPVTHVEGINWVYWTLAYEIAFYVVVGLYVWIRPLKWPLLIGLTIAAAVVGAKPPTGLFFLNYWTFFALGAALAEWRAGRRVLPAVVAALCCVDFALNQDIRHVVAAAATLATCAACLTPWGRFLNRERLFAWVGQWSYSLYLVHVPLGCVAGLGLANALFGPGLRHQGLAGHIFVDAVAFLVAALGALVFWRLVEAPSMAVMRAGPPKSRRPAVQTP